jgi:hypothetical protein
MNLDSQKKHSKDFEGVVVVTGLFHEAHFLGGLLETNYPPPHEPIMILGRWSTDAFLRCIHK